MAYQDLREYMRKIEENGEIQRIGIEVDWNLEAGAIMRKCCEEIAPAPFFQKIKAYPDGYRIFGNPLASWKRLAIALDMDPDSPFMAMLDRYDEGKKNPIKPNLLKDGPCKENIRIGKDVDLFQFPAPFLHGGDGGRYLCTWHIVACKDPDSGWVNWGMYRAMIHDKNSLGGIIIPWQHIGRILLKYEQKNESMPFTMAIGTEPITTMIGSCSIPYGLSEVDLIGGVRREPLNVVKCETNDLFVPATSEMVIEGEIPPHERKDEGPFGEYPGYQGSPRSAQPVYRVKAITHRNDPILTSSCMGVTVDDSDIVMGLNQSSEIRADLLRAGLPITGLYMPPECCQFLIIVATKNLYAGIANQIASCIWANKMGGQICKVIVVEDDVDPTNMKEVLHAWATVHHPIRGTHTVTPFSAHPLIPFLSRHDKLYSIGANMVFDCTWPKDWAPEDIPVKASFKAIYPKEIQERVLSNWKTKYGFKS